MQGYKISQLNRSTRQMIKQQNIDKNGDGLINEKNGELSELLSNTGSSCIQQLARFDKDRMLNTIIGCSICFPGIGIGVALKEKSLSRKAILSLRSKAIKPMFVAAMLLPLSLAYFSLHPEKRANLKLAGHEDREMLEPIPTLEPKTGIVETAPVQPDIKKDAIKAKFEEGFKELGISEDTELKEYTPQKGEYWTSILKAKYGVDEAVALRMTHKIKDIIYGDSLAAKQSPVMYLPETWTFEGKTNQYDENAKVIATDSYSDDVKTEMGKMSKDIKYE